MPRNELPVFRQRHPGFESGLHKFAVARVAEKRVVHLIIGDEDVHPAVQLKIRDPHAHSFSRMAADSGLRGSVAERAIAVVQEQLVGSRFIEFGMAIVEAARLCFTWLFRFDIPGQVVDYEKIQ